MSGHSVRVAVVQAEVASDLAAGLALTAELTCEAARERAIAVAFPETWLPGYPAWLDVCRDVALWDNDAVKDVYARMGENSVVVNGASGAAIAAAARESGVTLVVGVTERVESGRGSGTLYNSLLTYGPDGELLNHHRKLVPTYTERLVWGNGDADGLSAVQIPNTDARIGGLVCWEHWMPLARQALHESGEGVHVAVWPTAKEMHQMASRHYALEGRCFVLVAGSLTRASALPEALEPHPDRVTSSNQWLLRGGSAIIGPDGQYMVEPVYDEPRILIADLDLRRCRAEAMTLDVTGHYHRPDLFKFSVKRGRRSS